MKRIIALLLVLIVTLGCLAACSKTEAPVAETPKPETSAPAETPKTDSSANTETPAKEEAPKQETPKEIPTLVYYVPGDPQADLDLIMEEANKIIEPAIGARLDMRFIDTGSFKEKMNMMMTAQEVFDLTFVGYLNKYVDTVALGGLLKLNDLLDTVPALVEQVPDFLWDAATINGGIYAVPNEQIVANQYCSFTFKDLADEYGLDYENISSIPELEDYLLWIKENHPEMIPWRPNSGLFTIGEKQYETIIDAVAFDKTDPGCNVVYFYDTPEYLAGSAKRAEWLEKGIIREDILSVGDDSVDFKAGRYAVYQTVYKPGVEATESNKYGREVVAMKNIGTATIKAANCLSTMTGISRTCTHPEEAIKFIELINTNKELYNLICFGIEGVHYTLNDEGKAVSNPESGWYLAAGDWKFGCQFNALVREGQNDDVWEETKYLNEKADVSRLMGFTLDKDPIATEIANLNAVYDEYKFFVNGYATDYMDYEDEYRAKLNSVGLDKILDEVQRQVDEFLAQKAG